MEDVLEVYQRPYDGNEVLGAWMRRANSKSRRRECRVPQRPAYRRHTTTNTAQWSEQPVLLFAPLDGWRRVEVRERRTKVDWAHVIKKLVDVSRISHETAATKPRILT